MRRLLIILSFCSALFANFHPASAQIAYTSGTYDQTFDSLISSGTAVWTDNVTLPGWYTFRTGPALSCNLLRADNGSNSNTGVVYSYGDGTATNRAMGIIPGSTPSTVMWGVCFTNNSGQTLTSFNLTYDGEQWRAASTQSRSLQVAFQVGPVANLNAGTWVDVTPLNFNSLILSNTGQLDGTQSANSTPNITYSVARINWPPGAQLWIRWTNQEQSGGNASLAIDNVRFSASSTAVVDPYALLRQEALQSITDMDATLAASSTPDPQTRDLTLCAYLALSLNIPNAVSKAESYLETAFSYQLSDGNFPWNLQDGYNSDPNGVEFTMLSVCPIFLRYGSLLSGTFATYAMPHIQSAINAVTNQSVAVTYTNIYTMQFTNLLLLGQITGNGTAQSAGFANMNSWISNVQSIGMAEYDSPTYSEVDYGNLIILANNTSNPAVQSRMLSMLDFLSADLCANYVNGYSGNLGGGHSRDYSFPVGDDPISHFYYYAGVRQALPPLYDYNGGLDQVANYIEGGYSPSASITALASSSSHIVKQIWGSTAGQDHYTDLTSDYTIGSSSAFYGPQDKQISATFPALQLMNQVNVVYDNFDAPYGQININGKPVHLTNAPAIVQNQSCILSLSNLGPQFTTSSTTYTSIATNFIFPSNADELWLDGTLITAGTQTLSANLNSVLGVRVGNGLVAMKAFQIDGCGGYTPTAAIKFDGPDNDARLVLYHYQGSAISIPSATIRSGLFLTATSVTSDSAASAFLTQVANASITPVITGSTWSASVTFSGTTLAVSQNTVTNSILSRTVNGANYTPSRLLVTTGTVTTDYASLLLDPISSAPNQPPTFAIPATAAQNPVLSGTVLLSSTGADDGGEPNLTYTWSSTGTASVSFGANNSNAAKNSTATFTTPGAYTLQVVATDVGSLSATSSVTVTVNNCFGFWQAANFSSAQLSNPAISGDTASAAGDGISNLMKYALNLNPWQPYTSGLPILSSTGNNLTLTYTSDPTKTDLTYLVQTSTDLHSWTTTGVNQGAPGTTVTATVPKAGLQESFLRLLVTGP